MAGYLPLPALRLLHAVACLQIHRAFTALADMGDELAVRLLISHSMTRGMTFCAHKKFDFACIRGLRGLNSLSPHSLTLAMSWWCTFGRFLVASMFKSLWATVSQGIVQSVV